MSAVQPIAYEPLSPEYLLSASREGHHLTGVEIGLEKAIAVARGLALGGWRVILKSADPYIEDPLIMEVWSEDAPA